jgi:RND family efflux transporter MFP subunit
MAKEDLEKKQKRLPSKRVIIVVILLIFLFYRLRPDKDVDSAEVMVGDVAEELILSGVVKADEHANLAFQTSGKISWVGVKEGEMVKKGQALVSLDSTNLAADSNIADSTLRSKASSLDKVYDDLKGKEESETFEEKETRTAAETAKDSAVFSLVKAQKNLSNATLYAPFEGLITNITNPYSGGNILFSQSQIEMVNPETIYFEVGADQSEVLNLKEGQDAVIVLDALEKDGIKAKISFISYTPMGGETGTIYKVRLDVEDESFDSSSLRVGMTGDAKFVLEEKSDVLYLPPKFVNSDKNGRYVNLSTKNNKVYVEVGLEGEDRFEITGDIKEGDKVYD